MSGVTRGNHSITGGRYGEDDLICFFGSFHKDFTFYIYFIYFCNKMDVNERRRTKMMKIPMKTWMKMNKKLNP